MKQNYIQECFQSKDCNPQSPRSCKQACTTLGSIGFQKVAYIAFDNPDGLLLINVPLYIKVSELNKNGMTDGQEELIHRISEIMLKRYERQISEFMSKQKGYQSKDYQSKGADGNEKGIISDGM